MSRRSEISGLQDALREESRNADALRSSLKRANEFIEDLATLYPEIVNPTGQLRIFASRLGRYRIKDVHRVAEQIRHDRAQETTDRLMHEFRVKRPGSGGAA